MFKVSKKYTRTMCQIYSKLTIKTTEQYLTHLLLFKFRTYFALYSTVNIAELEQINVGWA